MPQDGFGGPDGVMTAFDGHVTFQNFDGMLIATAYRLGGDSVVSVLAALTPSNPKHEKKMDVNAFHNIYARSHEIASYYCKATRYRVDW